MQKTYDPKCFDLATAFLADEPDIDTPAAKITLAIMIQDTIEDEMNFMRSQMSKEPA